MHTISVFDLTWVRPGRNATRAEVGGGMEEARGWRDVDLPRTEVGGGMEEARGWRDVDLLAHLRPGQARRGHICPCLVYKT